MISNNQKVLKSLSLGPTSNIVHGDLTLSNIIVSSESLFFIDPIDHYLGKCILGDYFKLLFDLDFKLSFRIEGHYKSLEASVIINISRLMSELKSICCSKCQFMPNIQNIFLAVEALRVLQYSHTDIKLTDSLLRYIQTKIDHDDL